MSKRITRTHDPAGRLQATPDSLPRPEELADCEEAVRISIALSKRSVEFFKAEARRHGTKYQKMIRRLLDRYAEHYAGESATGPSRPRRRSAAP